MLKHIIALIVLVGACVNAQRVVPGVNPQHYQQQPVQHQQHPQHPPQYQQQQVHPNQLPPGVNPQQYQHQQQVQYQQVPVQQQQQVHMQQPVQQVPVQQVPVQQVPVQQQQVPVQQQVPQGHGGHHANHGQVLNAANIQHEKDHIQEHLHVPIDTSKMSEAELQFHYFKMHDSDNNNKLDGCELIKSLIHWHDDEEKQKEKTGGTGEKQGTSYTDDNLADIIDYVLSSMDLNKDGYVDYVEYRKSEEGSAKGNKQ